MGCLPWSLSPSPPTLLCLHADHLASLDSVDKVDPSNAPQMQLLHRCFAHNMATVNFWLNCCVFKDQTQQYPKSLIANSWHLADGPHVVGFSGTNDNHRLLPLQAKQAMLKGGEGGDNLESLRITNGQMLDCIIKCTHGYKTLLVVSESPGFHSDAEEGDATAGWCWTCLSQLTACPPWPPLLHPSLISLISHSALYSPIVALQSFLAQVVWTYFDG